MLPADCEVLCLNYSCTYRVQEMTQIKTISDMYKNVEGYFFQTICSSCLYKSVSSGGYEEISIVLHPLVIISCILCRSDVVCIYLYVVSHYPKIQTLCVHKIV